MTLAATVRVMIADDDPAVREALQELIQSDSALEFVGAASDAGGAIDLAASLLPDVVLLDVTMPGGGGEAAARAIRKCSPTSKLIVLSGHDDHATVLRMLEAGVVGYLVKGESEAEIVETIKRAPAGSGSLSRQITAEVIDDLVGKLRSSHGTQKRRQLSRQRIRRALAVEEALTMVFQPIVSLRDRAIVGAEALARFAGPPRRKPSGWFLEAKEVGLGYELELLAIGKAAKALDEIPPDLFLTVNASPSTIENGALLALVATLDGSRLVVEITEHAPIEDYQRLSVSVHRLRELGVRLAIDDAGAGFASLRHILQLEPDVIKLDLSLIRDIQLDVSKRALAAGLISFARESGATVIAEGIECAAEARTLIDLGVDIGQGYYLGRPGPLPLGSTRQRRRRGHAGSS